MKDIQQTCQEKQIVQCYDLFVLPGFLARLLANITQFLRALSEPSSSRSSPHRHQRKVGLRIEDVYSWRRARKAVNIAI